MANRNDLKVLAEWSAATSVKPSPLPHRRRPRPTAATPQEITSQAEMSAIARILAEIASLRGQIEELAQRIDALEPAATNRRTTASRPTTASRLTTKGAAATKSAGAGRRTSKKATAAKRATRTAR